MVRVITRIDPADQSPQRDQLNGSITDGSPTVVVNVK